VLAFAAVGFLVKKFKSRAQKRHEHEAMSVSAEPQSPNGHLSVLYENMIPGVDARALNQSECQNQQPTSASDADHRNYNLYQQLQFQNSTEHDSHAYDVIQTRDLEQRGNIYQQVQCQNSMERDSHVYDIVHA